VTICKHKRMRSIVLFLEPTPDQELRRAVMTIQCHLCGQPFEFAGVEGPGVTLSEDRRELRLTITEARKGLVN
jgi:hypothetical protein